jgi:threonine synthase
LEFFEPDETIENATEKSNDIKFTVGIPNTKVDKEKEEAIIKYNSARYNHPIKREFQDFQEAEMVVEFDKHHYNLNKVIQLKILLYRLFTIRLLGILVGITN